MRIAIIDLGSNSIRMNIVDIKDGKVNLLENIRKIVRLSEGMGDEKLLRPNAVNRTLNELVNFKQVIDSLNVDEIKAIATAALRTARNSELFINPAKKIGFDFEIVSGEKEAYYDYMSVVNTLPVDDCIIVDIGGASTEIILVKDGINRDVVSIPMAAVNITEKYFTHTVAKDGEFEYAVLKFTDCLKTIDWLDDINNIDVVGMGGTVRAIAKMHNVPDENVHGFYLDKDKTLETIYELIKLPIEKRALIDGIGKGRADIILGGVVPLYSIMNYIDSPKLITCVSSLREGVMYDILKK